MLFSHFLFLYIFPLLNFLSFDNDDMKLSKRQVSLISLTFIIIIAIIITVIIIIVSIITVFAGVLFVHQPGANHAPRASVTQVNRSVHTLSTFLRIRADPSMQIF